jgi:Fe2+ transport system protein FeoA
MAQESGRNKPAGKLSEEIALSRERVTRTVRGVRSELDFPRKIRKSFQTQTILWIGGAVVIGALLTVLSRGKKTIYVNAKGGSGTKSKQKLLAMGFAVGALRIASNLLKPIIVGFVERKVRDYASGSRSDRK